MDLSRISAMAAVFDSLHDPADGCCGGGIVYGGLIVSAFTLVYIGIALWLYISRKRGILAGLIAFSESYDQSRQGILREMLVPYAVATEPAAFCG